MAKSKSAISKSIRSKIAENNLLEKKNKTLKADLKDVKNKLQSKLHTLAKKVDSEVSRSKDTLGSVLADVKKTVVSAKSKTSKLISGGSARSRRKSNKQRGGSSWFW